MIFSSCVDRAPTFWSVVRYTILLTIQATRTLTLLRPPQCCNSERADGMFRYVACQVERLRRSFPAGIRSVLNDLPESFDETYGRTLLGIEKEKRKYAQRLFQCLIVPIRPHRSRNSQTSLRFASMKLGLPYLTRVGD